MIEVGRDRLWAEDSGGDGPPLVLLHPGIADLRVWDQVWGPLTETHRVIRYDVRGYGGSPAATEPYGWVEDLRAVLDHHGLASAHLVGNSNGGATALAMAVEEPARVRSLVLLAAGISGYPWPEEPELDQRYDALLRAGDGDGLIELMLELWCASGQEPVVRELVTAATVAETSGNTHWHELAPVWDRLGELTVPTVVMIGDRDPASMIEANKAAAERIPGARLVELAGVDHLPQLRVPELVVETVRAHCR
ncbi:MAG: alpha/beta fold hydrolase [Kineosporiaceae bacterium]